MADLDPKGVEAACIAFLEAFDDVGSTPADYRKEAEAAIRAYLDATDNGWMPIETAPKDGTYIIVHQTDVLEPADTICCFEAEWGDDGWWMCCDGKNPDLPLRGPTPTHWRPLLSPPKPEPQK